MAEAEMDAGAESDVPVRPSRKVEPFGMFVRCGIVVGGVSMAMIRSPHLSRTPQRSM
jgi:hypothetical protein